MGNLVFDSRALSFCAGRVPVLGRVPETGRKERESQPKSKWQSLKSKCFGVWRLCVGTLALALTGRVSLDVPATSPWESWVFSGETEPLLWGHVTVETSLMRSSQGGRRGFYQRLFVSVQSEAHWLLHGTVSLLSAAVTLAISSSHHQKGFIDFKNPHHKRFLLKPLRCSFLAENQVESRSLNSTLIFQMWTFYLRTQIF